MDELNESVEVNEKANQNTDKELSQNTDKNSIENGLENTPGQRKDRPAQVILIGENQQSYWW